MGRHTTIDKAGLFLNFWRLLVPGAPEPEREYRFDAQLGRKHRADFCFVEHKVIVEVDGGQYAAHGGRHATDGDREKLNIAASLGYRVLRFSPKQLTRDPQACIDIVLRALDYQPETL